VHRFPDRAVKLAAALQRCGGFACAIADVNIALFHAARVSRVDRFELIERERFQSVHRASLDHQTAKFVFERCDDEAHLEAPIAEVRVAPDLVAAEAIDALHAFADDRGTQVPDMHALGDVRPAVVHYDAALAFDGRSAGLWIVIGDELRALGQRVSGDFEVEKSWPGDARRRRKLSRAPLPQRRTAPLLAASCQRTWRPRARHWLGIRPGPVDPSDARQHASDRVQAWRTQLRSPR
jgi:hypothetical protein